MGAEPQPADRAQIGPFRLFSVLGEGGMGKVYLGRSAGGQLVAVKVIRREVASNRQFRDRFRREVAAAQKVNGLYTAHVVGADTDAAEPWLATAYIDGPSLKKEVEEYGPLHSEAVIGLAAALAEGLGQIHAAGLVHRDLKPSNVLLARDGPRIIDFGVAWSADAISLTPTDGTVGSPGYMSPEQSQPDREAEVGPLSDIFSLGAVLCYAARGYGPWWGGSTATLIYRAVHERPDLRRLPGDIRRVVAACLDKEPARRPASADILRWSGNLERPSYSRGSFVDWADTARLHAFRPRGTFAAYVVLGDSPEGSVFVDRSVARRLRAASSEAADEGQVTGGLLCGRELRDEEGAYLVVQDFIEAPFREMRTADAPRGGSGIYALSYPALDYLREGVVPTIPDADVVGWWHSPGTFRDLHPEDFGTPFTWRQNVELLVYGSGERWAMARHIQPDLLGHISITQWEDASERRTATLTRTAAASADPGTAHPAERAPDHPATAPSTAGAAQDDAPAPAWNPRLQNQPQAAPELSEDRIAVALPNTDAAEDDAPAPTPVPTSAPGHRPGPGFEDTESIIAPAPPVLATATAATSGVLARVVSTLAVFVAVTAGVLMPPFGIFLMFNSFVRAELRYHSFAGGFYEAIGLAFVVFGILVWPIVRILDR